MKPAVLILSHVDGRWGGRVLGEGAFDNLRFKSSFLASQGIFYGPQYLRCDLQKSFLAFFFSPSLRQEGQRGWSYLANCHSSGQIKFYMERSSPG